MTSGLDVDPPDTELSETGSAADGRETARSASPQTESGLGERQVEVLASLARLCRKQLDRTVMLHVAILRAHHLQVPKEDIRRQSGLKKSKMYEVVQETQRFVEKLQRDVHLEHRAGSFGDEHGHFVLSCRFCDGDFKSTAAHWVDTYPAMHRHWRERHSWSPKIGESQKGETPTPTDEWLNALGHVPLPYPEDDPKPRSDAHRQVRRLAEYAETYSRASEGETGDALSDAVEAIVQREYAMLRAQVRSAREQHDRDTALQDIRRHAFEAEYLRLGLNLEITRALALGVNAATIARITGLAPTTVARRRSEAAAHLGGMARLLGLESDPSADTSTEAGRSALSEAINRMLRSEEYRPHQDLREQSPPEDRRSALQCFDCSFKVTGDSYRPELLHHAVRMHWRIVHALIPDPTRVDVETVQIYHRMLRSVFGNDPAFSARLWASAHSSLHFGAQRRVEDERQEILRKWARKPEIEEVELARIEAELGAIDDVFADPRTDPPSYRASLLSRL